MKRPLFAVCLTVTCVIALWNLLHPPDLPDKAPVQEEIIVHGRIERKENRISYGKEQLILYLSDYSVISNDSNVSESAVRSGQTKSEKKNENKIVCYTTSAEWEPKMGSVVLVRGNPEDFHKATNPGEFDSRLYYATLGIDFCVKKAEVLWEGENYNVFTETLWRQRCLWQQRLDKVPGSDSASVLKTMLLGDKRSLDGQLKNLYQDGGIAHILAISGLHISIIGMGFYKVIRRFGVPVLLSAFLGAAIIFSYGILTGEGVSATRAVGMFLIRMLAEIVGRGYDMITALGVLMLWMVLEQPLYVYHSGFLLSFSALFGITLLLPVLEEDGKQFCRVFLSRIRGSTVQNLYCTNWKKRIFALGGKFGKNFLGSLAVSLATLPVTLWFFYEIPVCGIFLNLLVLPLVPAVLYLGLSLVLLPEGIWLSVPAFLVEAILKGMEGVCRASVALPYGKFIRGKPETWQVCVYVAVLVTVIIWKNRGRQRKKESAWGATGARLLLVVLSVFVLCFKGNGKAGVTFLDVGQGDGICIRTGDGSAYLVDCGSSSKTSVGKYVVAPFLKSEGISKLEAVIITHPDEDHCNGLKDLLEEGYGGRVGGLLLPDIPLEEKNEAYRELEQLAALYGIQVGYLSAGMKWQDGGFFFQCLHPAFVPSGGEGLFYADSNEYSVVLHVISGELSVLLTGDVEGEGEKKLTETLARNGIEKVTVLKVAHHGSRYSTSEKFVGELDIGLAVISCGEKNIYGHPHEETLSRLKACGAVILTTQECGVIRIESANDR